MILASATVIADDRSNTYMYIYVCIYVCAYEPRFTEKQQSNARRVNTVKCQNTGLKSFTSSYSIDRQLRIRRFDVELEYLLCSSGGNVDIFIAILFVSTTKTIFSQQLKSEFGATKRRKLRQTQAIGVNSYRRALHKSSWKLNNLK